MILVLFFLCVVPFHYFYGSLPKNNIPYDNSLKIAIQSLENLKQYGDPLSQGKQKRCVEADHAKSNLLEKGAFQYAMWLEYQKNPLDKRIINYMLYKTKKYGLQMYISCLHILPKLNGNVVYENNLLNNMLFKLEQFTGYHFFKKKMRLSNFILTLLGKLFNELGEFQQIQTEKLFTSEDMMSFTFLFAFLDDLAHKRKIDYAELSFDLLYSIHNQKKLDHKTLFLNILAMYKEGVGHGPINFDRLKAWYGNQAHFIFPIFNKKGTLG